MDFGAGHTITLHQQAEPAAPKLAQAFAEDEFHSLVDTFKKVLQKDANLFEDPRLFQLVFSVTSGMVGQSWCHA